MCFETTKSARSKIAKENIECWKLLESGHRPFYLNVRTPYEVGKLNPLIKLRKINGIIERGYHSWKSKNSALKRESIWFRCANRIKGVDYHLCKFIIPKGTRYYSNQTDYVSETIMLVE